MQLGLDDLTGDSHRLMQDPAVLIFGPFDVEDLDAGLASRDVAEPERDRVDAEVLGERPGVDGGLLVVPVLPPFFAEVAGLPVPDVGAVEEVDRPSHPHFDAVDLPDLVVELLFDQELVALVERDLG